MMKTLHPRPHEKCAHSRVVARNGSWLLRSAAGGETKDESSVLAEINEIAKGGGNGSIIGRNAFQRPKKDAIELLGKICNIYK